MFNYLLCLPVHLVVHELLKLVFCFYRQVDARKIAVTGFLLILKHFKVQMKYSENK